MSLHLLFSDSKGFHGMRYKYSLTNLSISNRPPRFPLRRSSRRLHRLRPALQALRQNLLRQPADRHLHLRARCPRPGAPRRQAGPRPAHHLVRAAAVANQPLRMAGLRLGVVGLGDADLQAPSRGSAIELEGQHDVHLQGLRRLGLAEDFALA